MPLKKITQQDRFYHELVKLQKQVDLLLRDYQATMGPDKHRKPMHTKIEMPDFRGEK